MSVARSAYTPMPTCQHARRMFRNPLIILNSSRGNVLAPRRQHGANTAPTPSAFFPSFRNKINDLTRFLSVA